MGEAQRGHRAESVLGAAWRPESSLSNPVALPAPCSLSLFPFGSPSGQALTSLPWSLSTRAGGPAALPDKSWGTMRNRWAPHAARGRPSIPSSGWVSAARREAAAPAMMGRQPLRQEDAELSRVQAGGGGVSRVHRRLSLAVHSGVGCAARQVTEPHVLCALPHPLHFCFRH